MWWWSGVCWCSSGIQPKEKCQHRKVFTSITSRWTTTPHFHAMPFFWLPPSPGPIFPSSAHRVPSHSTFLAVPYGRALWADLRVPLPTVLPSTAVQAGYPLHWHSSCQLQGGCFSLIFLSHKWLLKPSAVTLEKEQRATWLEAACAKRCDFWSNLGPCPSKTRCPREVLPGGEIWGDLSLPGLVALPLLVCTNLGQALLARGTCCCGPFFSKPPWVVDTDTEMPAVPQMQKSAQGCPELQESEAAHPPAPINSLHKENK